jgi:N-sulfoglucosamine sulfohydrolase
MIMSMPQTHAMMRLKTIVVAAALILVLAGSQSVAGEQASSPGPNILLITADDLNYDSVGCYGSPVPGITPNIDRLASRGMRFTNAHVNIAVCQPSRQSIMTGLYPRRNGAEGFDPINADVRTLQEYLHNAGYLNGVMGKEVHLRPKEKFYWDYYITEVQLASGAGIGRSPERYAEYATAFFDEAKERSTPFFLMANSHDPHRPFAGSDQEKKYWGDDLPAFTRQFSSDEVIVPNFLPDLPPIRKETAEYYTSVYRCDQTVGALLDALEESGLAGNTMVMFISDNGMATPFAKSNCYLNSTKTPWIVSWPGIVEPGAVDSKHLISGIDYMPTILDALDIESTDSMDGFSFLPLLNGKKQRGRRYVFTEYHRTFAGRCYPMRCVQDKRFGYIINFWAGRTNAMRMDSTSGLTFKAMKDAAVSNPEIAKRVALFEHRVLEEFYDFENDPGGLNNLIDDPRYQSEVKNMRRAMKKQMTETQDFALQAFLDRDKPEALDAFMEEQRIRAESKRR